MIRAIRLELLKLRTSPAFFVTLAAAIGLSFVSAVTTVLLPVKKGDPALGSVPHAAHVFEQPGAVTSMAMFILGVLMIAGEYRQRTILTTFLAEPRRGRVLVAKFVTAGLLGAVIAAIGYIAVAITVVPIYASKGVHHVPIDLTSVGIGTVLSGACYGLLGVAVGALTRNTVAAIISGLIWIQIIEVAILENLVPSLARWLPAGAAQGLTAVVQSSHNLPQVTSAAVLVAWAVVLVALARQVSVRRELR